MARPIKNSCDYFPHDAGMRSHRKIKAIRNTFGITGYAIWVMLIEYLTDIDGNEFEQSEIEFELMSGDFGVTVEEIQNVVNYCIKINLLFINNGFIYSESLNERLAPVYSKRGKSKELSKQQLRVNGSFCSSNPVGDALPASETPQSKEKERKGNDESEFSTPSSEDLKIGRIIEMFKRVKVWNEWELKVEAGKFLNKYEDIDLQKCGGLINTWAANHQESFLNEFGKVKEFDTMGNRIYPHGTAKLHY